MSRPLVLLATTLLVAPLLGQRILHNHALPLDRRLGPVLRTGGDTNGDGVQDFVVAVEDVSISGVYEVQVASGLDGSLIRTLSGLPPSWIDAIGIGDADNDGRSDIAILTSSQ
ncbi:MAG TPA: hypothetical protein VFT55_03545, partial [Planctomycetota bacterium]|nr:hypothetical protein [Planctomycetota bacterium]